MAAFTELVFSGVQPTGNLHLGNYLGAIKRFVELEKRPGKCLYCVVDLHAITVWQDPQALRGQIREVTAAFLAAGIDPKRSIVFNQSQVPQHAELAWILNCVARLGWLSRMTQFKDKAGKDRENASIGLYDYPVLMAADILAYRATHVPVGEDQKQHLELARDIAKKFNKDWQDQIFNRKDAVRISKSAEILDMLRDGEYESIGKSGDYMFFPTPEPIIGGEAARVMSLRDGSKKMSKSDPSEYSRINLTDDESDISQKIKKAKTDPLPLPEEISELNSRPEANNLVGIYAALSGVSRQKVLDEFGGSQFSKFKPALVDLAVETLGPIGSEMKRLVADPAYIDSVLADGAERAERIAAPTLDAVKDIVGFVRRGPALRAV